MMKRKIDDNDTNDNDGDDHDNETPKKKIPMKQQDSSSGSGSNEEAKHPTDHPNRHETQPLRHNGPTILFLDEYYQSSNNIIDDNNKEQELLEDKSNETPINHDSQYRIDVSDEMLSHLQQQLGCCASTTVETSTTTTSSSDPSMTKIDNSSISSDSSSNSRNDNKSRDSHDQPPIHSQDNDSSSHVVRKFLDRMTKPPSVTICRLNKIKCTNRSDVMTKLNNVLNTIVNERHSSEPISKDDTSRDTEDQQQHLQQDLWDVQEDPIFDDVIHIVPSQRQIQYQQQEGNLHLEQQRKEIYDLWFPPDEPQNHPHNHLQQESFSCTSDADIKSPLVSTKTTTDIDIDNSMVQSKKTRNTQIVLVDQFCGEAVLRGSDIFVRGVIGASPGIWPNDRVAVFADLPINRTNTAPSANIPIPRGFVIRPIPAVAIDDTQQQQQQQQEAEPQQKASSSSSSSSSSKQAMPYYRGTCVFVGYGTVQLPRKDIFTLSHGVAITMSLDPWDRPYQLVLPPLHNVLADQIMLQNLPSVLVAHTLNPQPNDIILDMCAAPGGKTSHLASLVHNQATIVACDKSRKKILSTATDTFQRFGATCITPLALDTTKCLLSLDDDGDNDNDNQTTKSIQTLFEEAPIHPEDGLKDVTHFPPCSFDRILLDPPCSALGLRPKLMIQQQQQSKSSKSSSKSSKMIKTLQRHAIYQKRFVDVAIELLKPGGYLTYSTCTVTVDENERMVAYILEEQSNNHSSMELLQVPYYNGMMIGDPGLPNVGLSEEQRHKVRRFDPTTTTRTTNTTAAHTDTMGFFLALFRKKERKMK